jgi:hypothetical protein
LRSEANLREKLQTLKAKKGWGHDSSGRVPAYYGPEVTLHTAKKRKKKKKKIFLVASFVLFIFGKSENIW